MRAHQTTWICRAGGSVCRTQTAPVRMLVCPCRGTQSTCWAKRPRHGPCRPRCRPTTRPPQVLQTVSNNSSRSRFRMLFRYKLASSDGLAPTHTGSAMRVKQQGAATKGSSCHPGVLLLLLAVACLAIGFAAGTDTPRSKRAWAQELIITMHAGRIYAQSKGYGLLVTQDGSKEVKTSSTSTKTGGGGLSLFTSLLKTRGGAICKNTCSKVACMGSQRGTCMQAACIPWHWLGPLGRSHRCGCTTLPCHVRCCLEGCGPLRGGQPGRGAARRPRGIRPTQRRYPASPSSPSHMHAHVAPPTVNPQTLSRPTTACATTAAST